MHVNNLQSMKNKQTDVSMQHLAPLLNWCVGLCYCMILNFCSCSVFINEMLYFVKEISKKEICLDLSVRLVKNSTMVLVLKLYLEINAN